MRILFLCPLWFPISKNAPGGIETVLAHLSTELSHLGCEVTLIATGDSDTSCTVLPVVPKNLYAQMQTGSAEEYLYYEQQQIHMALDHAAEFDLVHSHVGPGAYALSGVTGLKHRVLHTIHSPVYKDLQWFVSTNPDIWFSTVSEFQSCKLREHGAKHCFPVPNGIDTASFTFNRSSSRSLLFLGRIEREKGPDLAIRIAEQCGLPLTLAGPIVQHEFFKHEIQPLLNQRIQYVGVVDHAKKNELLGSAGCVLMPSRWDEPFGMVALEAMACGTPVVALANGALPEIVEPGLTGYLAKQEDEMPRRVLQAIELNRIPIRERVSHRFDVSRIAELYLALFQQMIASRGENYGT